MVCRGGSLFIRPSCRIKSREVNRAKKEFAVIIEAGQQLFQRPGHCLKSGYNAAALCDECSCVHPPQGVSRLQCGSNALWSWNYV